MMSKAMKTSGLVALMLFAGATWAADEQQPPQGGQPPAPPQAAVDACASKAANDSCTFSAPDGKSFSGTCSAMPGNSTLVCGPKGGMGHPPKGGKPPEGAPAE
jgi:hypothetical protein